MKKILSNLKIFTLILCASFALIGLSACGTNFVKVSVNCDEGIICSVNFSDEIEQNSEVKFKVTLDEYYEGEFTVKANGVELVLDGEGFYNYKFEKDTVFEFKGNVTKIVESIDIEQKYFIGQNFEDANEEVVVNFKNGKTEHFSEYQVEGFNSQTVGVKNITISNEAFSFDTTVEVLSQDEYLNFVREIVEFQFNEQPIDKVLITGNSQTFYQTESLLYFSTRETRDDAGTELWIDGTGLSYLMSRTISAEGYVDKNIMHQYESFDDAIQALSPYLTMEFALGIDAFETYSIIFNSMNSVSDIQCEENGYSFRSDELGVIFMNFTFEDEKLVFENFTLSLEENVEHEYVISADETPSGIEIPTDVEFEEV